MPRVLHLDHPIGGFWCSVKAIQTDTTLQMQPRVARGVSLQEHGTLASKTRQVETRSDNGRSHAPRGTRFFGNKGHSPGSGGSAGGFLSWLGLIGNDDMYTLCGARFIARAAMHPMHGV
jgi:hypothetical protein